MCDLLQRAIGQAAQRRSGAVENNAQASDAVLLSVPIKLLV